MFFLSFHFFLLQPSFYPYDQVPSVCIEHVYIWDNTTVIVDEVLAHRIGLVPLNIDPSTMTMRSELLVQID